MPLQIINIGAAPNDKTGTPARVAGQMINENFANLQGQIENIQFPDAVLKKGNIETSGLDVHVDADAFEWRIDQVDYFDVPEFDAVLDAATDGYYRKDVLLGNTSGGYNIFKGTEDPVSASEPNVFPVGTIKLGVIDVYGADVTGSVPVDLSGYVTKDEFDEVIADIELNKADITYVDSKVSSVYKVKGSVANFASLPNSGNTTGDVWNLIDTGMNYVWTGSVWDALGTSVDISGKEDSSNKTSSLSGKEASNSWFGSANGITSWIKNTLIGWIGEHSSPIVSTDTLLIGKAGVLGTRTVADLMSNISVKRKHIMMFSWSTTNLSQANGYWFGQTVYNGKYNMAFSASVSFTPDNNFSSLNPAYGHSEPPPFRSKITKCFVSGFCNGTQNYDYEIAIVNFKLLPPPANSSYGNGYDHKILARQKFPIGNGTIINRPMDSASLDLNYVLETNSYFKIFLNAGTGTDRPIQNPYIYIELEEII